MGLAQRGRQGVGEKNLELVGGGGAIGGGHSGGPQVMGRGTRVEMEMGGGRLLNEELADGGAWGEWA